MPIKYVKGDIFEAVIDKKDILIPHVCNDIGGWGSGFVVSLSKFDKLPEECYRTWARGESSSSIIESNRSFGLGETQITGAFNQSKNSWLTIANMVAQHKTINTGEKIPLRYTALVKCMQYVALRITQATLVTSKEIYCPKFGSGLAKGNWDFIEALINEIWVDSGIPVTVFELYERKK